MATMLRVDETTRDAVLRLARDDFAGASADQVVRELLAEHRVLQAIRAMDDYRAAEPDGWAEYLEEADRLDQGAAAPDAAP